MRRHIVLVIVGVVLAVSLGAAPPPTPTAAPPGPQAIQQFRLDAARATASGWGKLEVRRGAVAAVSEPASKKVWVAAVGAPGGANVGEAGFKLLGLSSGSTLPGMTAKARFEIEAIAGRVVCQVFVQDMTTRATVANGQVTASATGPQEVTTTPFTVHPQREYQAWASVLVRFDGPVSNGAFAVARIPEITW